MAQKGNNRHLASPKMTPDEKATSSTSKPVALTVKVDDDTYIRLCTLGATQRRTNQDILRQALHDYLERMAR